LFGFFSNGDLDVSITSAWREEEEKRKRKREEKKREEMTRRKSGFSKEFGRNKNDLPPTSITGRFEARRT
jgi:hypothetical protein